MFETENDNAAQYFNEVNIKIRVIPDETEESLTFEFLTPDGYENYDPVKMIACLSSIKLLKQWLIEWNEIDLWCQKVTIKTIKGETFSLKIRP